MRVTILAATGQVGVALIDRLRSDGHTLIAVGRNADKLDRLGGGIVTRRADFDDGLALALALADAELIVCCGHARHLSAILSALPATGVRRIVAMGSTRVFSAIADETGDAVRAGIAALADAPVPAVMLLATMIYGGGLGVVEGLALRLRQMPILPVPGGAVRVQPIHVADVAACLAAALTEASAPGTPIVIAGQHPLTYQAMVTAIRDARVPGGRILPVPVFFWRAAAKLASILPGMGGVGRALGRLCEDRVFDLQGMQARLNISSREFQP